MVIPRAVCGVSHQPDRGASGCLEQGSKNHAAEAEATFLRIDNSAAESKLPTP